MTEHMRTELVSDALQMAVHRRKPEPGLIHHSDQGSQYVALGFGQQARDAGIAVSMGSGSRCRWDPEATATTTPSLRASSPR
jgi:putative transposase